MELFLGFSGQIACEICRRQNLFLITFVYCFTRFVSLGPASEVADGPFELFSCAEPILVSTKNATAPGFGHNEQFLFF